MSKKRDLNQTDKALFDEMVRSVKPLKIKNQKEILKTPLNTQKLQQTEKPQQSLIHFTENEFETRVTSDSVLSYKEPSISHKILRNLRKGQYNVDAMIDLHGMTVETARESLIQFLSNCIRKNCRVVLIIHGRKRSSNAPVLKAKINIWLRSTSFVLAFCSADSSHGSQGALYVLLRRNLEIEEPP